MDNQPVTERKEGWLCATAVCRICGHQHIAVYPESCDDTAMECSNCHHMAAEAVEYHGPGTGK